MKIPYGYIMIFVGQTQNGDLFYSSIDDAFIPVKLYGSSVQEHFYIIREIEIPKGYFLVEKGFSKRDDLSYYNGSFIITTPFIQYNYFDCLIRKYNNRIFLDD